MVGIQLLPGAVVNVQSSVAATSTVIDLLCSNRKSMLCLVLNHSDTPEHFRHKVCAKFPWP